MVGVNKTETCCMSYIFKITGMCLAGVTSLLLIPPSLALILSKMLPTVDGAHLTAFVR